MTPELSLEERVAGRGLPSRWQCVQSHKEGNSRASSGTLCCGSQAGVVGHGAEEIVESQVTEGLKHQHELGFCPEGLRLTLLRSCVQPWAKHNGQSIRTSSGLCVPAMEVQRVRKAPLEPLDRILHNKERVYYRSSGFLSIFQGKSSSSFLLPHTLPISILS